MYRIIGRIKLTNTTNRKPVSSRKRIACTPDNIKAVEQLKLAWAGSLGWADGGRRAWGNMQGETSYESGDNSYYKAYCSPSPPIPPREPAQAKLKKSQDEHLGVSQSSVGQICKKLQLILYKRIKVSRRDSNLRL